MHGLIFVSMRDYLVAEHGATTEQDVMAGAPRYLVSEAYPDERFIALVDRACLLTGLPRETLLHDFGVYTAEKTFARLYPALFALSPTARTFLLTVETSIHQVVRVALPDAVPPELDVSERQEGAVLITYTSPRRLCAMLRGLVEGTARHYREKVRIEELACMDRADDACRFELRFGRS
ncbi:MAG: heme NO-binding domain-containing protein [Gaiellaceae bacterium]